MARTRLIGRMAIFLLALVLLWVSGVGARPITPRQAQLVVKNWLSSQQRPLGAALGRRIKGIKTFADQFGHPLYFVVYLEPGGLVIVSGDDRVEPIIAFAPTGVYDPSPANPLGALVSRDVPERVSRVRELAGGSQGQGPPAASKDAVDAVQAAQRKWSKLEAPKVNEGAPPLPSIDDPRVVPFVHSQWDQEGIGTGFCYNYYTPWHWPCGCVATAMAQVMRRWEHPTLGVGSHWFLYHFKMVLASWWGYLRGGDGTGGPYQWNLMELHPLTATVLDDAQRQAIGALCWDAGLAAGSLYNSKSSDVVTPWDAAFALKDTFQYGNAVYCGFTIYSVPLSNFYNMVNPNLDALYPVIIGIQDSDSLLSGKHAAVIDGYGYNAGTPYHHLNCGFNGTFDLWYNLPNIDPNWTNFSWVIYNIYTQGSGEIVSGRVMDSTTNKPIPEATVSASGGGQTYPDAHTDGNGIYYFSQVPSNTTLTLTASKAGYQSSGPSPSVTATTYKSLNGYPVSGNVWGVNFLLAPLPAPTKYNVDTLGGYPGPLNFINNNNEIVGYAPDFWTHKNAAFYLHWDMANRYSDKVATFSRDGIIESWAYCINDSGFVVVEGRDADYNRRGFIWKPFPEPGFVHELVNLSGETGKVSRPVAINNQGQIVGYADAPAPDFQTYPCIWPAYDQKPQPLETTLHNSILVGINQAGQVVGYENSVRTNNLTHAVTWEGGIWRDLDAGSSPASWANAINSLGQIVGYQAISNGSVAYLWDKVAGGQALTLGGAYTYSSANAINGQGQVVGRTNWAAFFWQAGKGITKLNDLLPSVAQLQNATGINDQGLIIGSGMFGGQNYNLILTPK
jgi:uncharacterized membrane protein